MLGEAQGVDIAPRLERSSASAVQMYICRANVRLHYESRASVAVFFLVKWCHQEEPEKNLYSLSFTTWASDRLARKLLSKLLD